MRIFKPNIKKLQSKRDINGLIKALEDKDVYVRRAAAYALGEIGDAKAVEGLIKALGDKNVSMTAMEALGKIGDAKAVEPLIKALGDENNLVSWYAAEALRAINTPEAQSALKKYKR